MLARVGRRLRRLWPAGCEDGQGMVEYGLIVALMAIGLIAALGALNGSLAGIFSRVSTVASTSLP